MLVITLTMNAMLINPYSKVSYAVLCAPVGCLCSSEHRQVWYSLTESMNSLYCFVGLLCGFVIYLLWPSKFPVFVQRYATLDPIIYEYKYGFGIIIVYGLFLLTHILFGVSRQMFCCLFSLCFDSVLTACYSDCTGVSSYVYLAQGIAHRAEEALCK